MSGTSHRLEGEEPRAWRQLEARLGPGVGMGCAAFGGSSTPRAAERALSSAYGRGVRYFDVARSYGFGVAEEILGRFLVGRRDQVVLATKVGLLPEPMPAWRRMARQHLAGPARRVRARLRRWNGPRRMRDQSAAQASRPPRVWIDASAVRRSLEASLRALRTDHVDILLLHSVPDACVDEELMRIIEDIRARGEATLIGLATDAGEAARILAREPGFDWLQLRDNLWEPGLDAVNPGGRGVSLHSILGRDGARLADLLGRLVAQPALAQELSEALDAPVATKQGVARLLVAAAVARCPDAVLIFGMSNDRHIAANLEAVRYARAHPERVAAVRGAIGRYADVLGVR